MNKIILILGIVALLIIAGCVDNTTSINHCAKLGLQYTGKVLGCNVECINVTTGQLYRFNADCKFIGR